MNMCQAAPLSELAEPIPAHSGILQRKCACGGPTALSGECEECRRERLLGGKRLGIQRKLAINSPGDRYEQEADLMADTVMRTSLTFPSGLPRHITRVGSELNHAVQRVEDVGLTQQAVETEEPLMSDPDSEPDVTPQIAALHGGGQSLEGPALALMESHFGHDFSKVRIHADAQAANAARLIGARAFTVGGDVVFGAGQYQPGTTEGKKLLAHELTHVVQQGTAQTKRTRQSTVPAFQQVKGQIIQRKDVPYGARILSLDEIKRDPAKEERRRFSGQTKAKVCRSSGKSLTEENCPVSLPENTDVTVVKELLAARWLQIDCGGIPGFGPKEQRYVLGAFVKPHELPEARMPPLKEALAKPAGPGVRERAAEIAGGIPTPERYAQLRCVVRRGGCATGISREAGVPELPELTAYNEECKKETGYQGGDLTPTLEECEEFKTAESLYFMNPARLDQLVNLLDECGRLVRAGTLRDDEIHGINAAISQANDKLEEIYPEGTPPPKDADTAPWVVTSAAGLAVPAPSSFAAAGSRVATGSFSSAALSGTVGSALAGALVAAGLIAMAYVVAHYQLRLEATAAVETLIGTLISLLQKLTEAQLEEAVKPKTGPTTGPKPRRGPKRRPKPKRPPIPPIGVTVEEEEEPLECTENWVPSAGGDRNHNDYARHVAEKYGNKGTAALDYDLIPPDYRRARFDHYDPVADQYFEVKTKHEALLRDWDTNQRWVLDRLLEQSARQREVLIRCQRTGPLIWFFDNPEVKEAAAGYLADNVDEVRHEPW